MLSSFSTNLRLIQYVYIHTHFIYVHLQFNLVEESTNWVSVVNLHNSLRHSSFIENITLAFRDKTHDFGAHESAQLHKYRRPHGLGYLFT